MKLLLLFLLALPAAAKDRYRFDYKSPVRIEYDRNDCKRFDETGTGCSKAIITFGRMLVGGEMPEVVTLEYYDRSHNWTGTVRYKPSKCKPRVDHRGRFDCEDVSWRLP